MKDRSDKTKTNVEPCAGESGERPLVEGRDYYVESGNIVFTEAYHLKRGHCCESGCRHCPYGFSKTPYSDS